MDEKHNGSAEAAKAAGSGRFNDVIDGLAQRVGARAGTVFGEPVERAGVTVIPVAKVRWGFGGGGGKRTADDADGAGGGGGVATSPIGFIEIRDGGAVFRRINDPGSLVPVALAGAVAFWIVLRSLRSLFH